MNETVNLSINGRIVMQLGDALISDEIMALSELIKNAYDADSNYVNIVVDTYCEEPFIKVIDDGCGMDLEIIKEGFLKIGSDIKEHEKVSKKYKRITQGNKGIGRLSLNKLSKVVDVITQPESNKNSSCFHFSIDWTEFESATDVSNVAIEINESQEHYAYYFKDRLENKHGTVLFLKNINNVQFWRSKNLIGRIKEEIIALIDPYIDREKSFNVFMNINGEIVDVSNLDFDVLERNATVKSKFEFINDNQNYTVAIEVNKSREYINHRIEKELKRLHITEPEFSVEINKESIYNKFCSREYVINLEKLEEFSYLERNFKRGEDQIDYMPDSFFGQLYAFDYTSANVSVDKKIIETMLGMNLYRNGFRIFPYGKDYDWFNFTGYSQRLKANIYRLHTVSGYVKIDGEGNLKKLKEMTNRKGIIEDVYGSNFLSIIKDIVSRQLVEDDINFRKDLSINSTKINNLKSIGEYEDVLNDGTYRITRQRESIEKIKSELTEKNKNKDEQGNIEISSAEIDKVIEGLDNSKSSNLRMKSELLSKERMLDRLMGVIGSALISEKLSHEILRNTETIKKNSKTILGYNDETELGKFRNKVAVVFSKAKYLDKLASTLDKNSYSRRKEIEGFDLLTFLKNSIFENFSEIFIEKKIQLEIDDDEFFVEVSKEEILIAFENMIINSIDWFEINNSKKCKITIKLTEDKNAIEYYDNGVGIHRNIEENLFEPFVTLKPLSAKGRGIGLYIVQTLITENNGHISLSEERNSNDNRFKFIIEFDKEEK